MKTLKEFFRYEPTWFYMSLFVIAAIIPVAFILALRDNAHPTTEHVITCWFMVVLFIVLAGFVIWFAVDDFRNRVR